MVRRTSNHIRNIKKLNQELTKLVADLQGEVTILEEQGLPLEVSTLVDALRLDSGIKLPQELRRIEIRLIAKALELTGGSQVHAAELLGIHATTLNTKIKRYAL